MTNDRCVKIICDINIPPSVYANPNHLVSKYIHTLPVVLPSVTTDIPLDSGPTGVSQFVWCNRLCTNYSYYSSYNTTFSRLQLRTHSETERKPKCGFSRKIEDINTVSSCQLFANTTSDFSPLLSVDYSHKCQYFSAERFS